MTSTPKSRQGFTILLLAVTLLIISTLLLLFAARYSALQQKITSNLYKDQQAFQAAQAGIEAAFPYFEANYSAIVASAHSGFLTPYRNSNTQNVALGNGSTYTFVFSNPSANNYQFITITSTGVSADGSSTRSLTQQIYAYTTGTPPPSVSLMTQGSLSMFNNARINNTNTNANATTGSTVNIDNNATTNISSGVGSNASKLGSDVTQHDSAIASLSSANFFQSVMGVSESTAQSHATFSYSQSGINSYNNLNGVTGAVIWINENGIGYTSGNTTIGSPTNPVVMIISGSMLFLDNTTIYGLVFVMNDSLGSYFFNNATINGALVSTGDLNFFNNAAENYNASILNALPSVGGASSYAKLPASWRDF